MESKNIDAEDIDEEEGIKLRGDKIGDTMYSASFITKTLLKLTEVDWNDGLEKDMCFLWDMTLEKDVCDYLLSISYPSIAVGLIKEAQECRLIEILIGILANIFSLVLEERYLTDIDRDNILTQLYSDDPLIIIQVMRFIKAIRIVYNEVEFVTPEILSQIRFILTSSTNVDLLVYTLDVLSKLTNDYKANGKEISVEIIPNLFTAVEEIKNKNEEGSSEVRNVYVYVMQIVCNICANYENSEFGSGNNIKRYSNVFVTEFSPIFNYFSQEENLLPVPDELPFYAKALSYIFNISRPIEFPVMFESVCKILSILIKENYEESSNFLELLNTIVALAYPTDLQGALTNFPYESFQHIIERAKRDRIETYQIIKLVGYSCKK